MRRPVAFDDEAATLETARLVLRPAATGDGQGIFEAYASDPEAMRYLMFAALTQVAQAEEYVRHTIELRAAGVSVTWVIVLRETATTIGAFDLRLDEPAADIGFAIGRTWWGHGYIPEAAAAVLTFAREHLGIVRFTGACDYENVRSARVFEKLGFRRITAPQATAVHPAFGATPRPVISFELEL